HLDIHRMIIFSVSVHLLIVFWGYQSHMGPINGTNDVGDMSKGIEITLH
ncbi:hypothetical protein NDU88_003788, partial [Pleurodeles waltl]